MMSLKQPGRFGRTFPILLQKELRSIFAGPFAYVVMGFVLILTGVAFRFAVDGMAGQVSQSSLLYLTFNSLWFWMVFFLLFPLITMRLFAEEKKQGTFETLMTAPVSELSVLLSKYVATLIFYCVIWAPTMLHFAIFEAISGSGAAFHGGEFLGTYLILLFIGAFNVALGCLASSLTQNQVIAAMIAFCLVTCHFFLGFAHVLASRMPADVVKRVSYFSTFEHIKLFSQGLIDSRPLIYYTSSAALVLVVTLYILEHRRWQV